MTAPICKATLKKRRTIESLNKTDLKRMTILDELSRSKFGIRTCARIGASPSYVQESINFRLLQLNCLFATFTHNYVYVNLCHFWTEIL